MSLYVTLLLLCICLFFSTIFLINILQLIHNNKLISNSVMKGKKKRKCICQ